MRRRLTLLLVVVTAGVAAAPGTALAGSLRVQGSGALHLTTSGDATSIGVLVSNGILQGPVGLRPHCKRPNLPIRRCLSKPRPIDGGVEYTVRAQVTFFLQSSDYFLNIVGARRFQVVNTGSGSAALDGVGVYKLNRQRLTAYDGHVDLQF